MVCRLFGISSIIYVFKDIVLRIMQIVSNVMSITTVLASLTYVSCTCLNILSFNNSCDFVCFSDEGSKENSDSRPKSPAVSVTGPHPTARVESDSKIRNDIQSTYAVSTKNIVTTIFSSDV